VPRAGLNLTHEGSPSQSLQTLSRAQSRARRRRWRLPPLRTYQENIPEKLKAFDTPGGGLIERTGRMLWELNRDIAGAEDAANAMPVTLQPPPASPLDTVEAFVTPLLDPLKATVPELRIVVGLWSMEAEAGRLRSRLARTARRGTLHQTRRRGGLDGR
jgi:hypothetical protein